MEKTYRCGGIVVGGKVYILPHCFIIFRKKLVNLIRCAGWYFSIRRFCFVCAANWGFAQVWHSRPSCPSLTLWVSCRNSLTCVENGESLPSSVVRISNRRTYCTHPKSPRMKKGWGLLFCRHIHIPSSLHTYLPCTESLKNDLVYCCVHFCF